MSLFLLLWFFAAHLKDFLDILSGSEGVCTVGHSYLQCKHTHTFVPPLTVGKLLINERVDSGSGPRLPLSRSLMFSSRRCLPHVFKTGISKSFLWICMGELRKGAQCGCCPCDVVAESTHYMLRHILMKRRDSRLKTVCLINLKS